MRDKLIEKMERELFQMKNKLLALELTECIKDVSRLISSKRKLLSEGPIESHFGPLEKELDEMIFKLSAAKRALGLANKLKDPDQKRYHQARVMGLLNKIRTGISQIQRTIGVKYY